MFKFFAIVAAAAATLFAGVYAQDLTINTPTTGIVVCQPLLITWTGGTAPYFLSLLPGGQPSATPLRDFGRQNGTSLTWVVDQPAGTSLGLTLRDSTGRVAQSAPFTVVASTDSSCLTSTGSRSSTSTTSTSRSGTSTTGTSTTGTSTTGTSTTSSRLASGSSIGAGSGGGASSGTTPSASPSPTGTSGSLQLVAHSTLLGALAAAALAFLA